MPEQPQNINVQIENLADFMPSKFNGESDTTILIFFTQFVTWLDFHPTKFHTNALKVGALGYCLSSTTSEWWNSITVADRLGIVDALKIVFLNKFRIDITRLQLKSELANLKYEPNKPFLKIINSFQSIATQLGYT